MNASAGDAALRRAVEAYGSDFARWPDAGLAKEARSALLANRAFRAAWEGAASLDRALAAAREAADGEIAASGAIARILRALAAEAPERRRWSPRSLIAMAAALVVAAGLGSAIDMTVIGSSDNGYDVVVVDPLVFGPAQVDLR